MFNVKHVIESDKAFWYSLDEHLSEREFELKVRDKRGYIIFDGDSPIGLMRYNLMYDIIPFLTLIIIEDAYQQKGFGKQAISAWENEMRALGYKIVMTSTQVNEQAQHFYRKLGYIERGSLFLDGTPYEQPQEMFMIKVL